MTIGEKIQVYRKKIGLSQEELGQKMLVSRQTVSLWEMDKTLPTVDNLIRLKQIFSVSIDDILSESEPIEEKNEARESYVFKYEKAELREVSQKERFQIVKSLIVFILFGFFLLVCLAQTEISDIIFFLVLCGLFLGVFSHGKDYFACYKACKKSRDRMLQSTYSYEIFEGYFVLNISRNGEITRTQKIYFDDVEKIQSFGKYFVLHVLGQSYIIKKEALIPNSAFISLYNGVPDTLEEKKLKNKLKTISILLFVLSICAIWGAMLVLGILLSASKQVVTENIWVLFLFLPIPITSIAFGLYLKKKGYKYKINVVVGIVVALFLCIYGSFSFVFAGLYSHGNEPIQNAEQILGIDVPQHSQINTQDWTKGTQSVPRGYIYSTSDIYFDEAAVEEFEKKLSSDEKWITKIPNDMVGITSYFCDIQTSDYYIIYNKDTGEFNKLPSSSGTYVFINVLYNAESNTMKLVEYQIEYTK